MLFPRCMNSTRETPSVSMATSAATSKSMTAARLSASSEGGEELLRYGARKAIGSAAAMLLKTVLCYQGRGRGEVSNNLTDWW